MSSGIDAMFKKFSALKPEIMAALSDTPNESVHGWLR